MKIKSLNKYQRMQILFKRFKNKHIYRVMHNDEHVPKIKIYLLNHEDKFSINKLF